LALGTARADPAAMNRRTFLAQGTAALASAACGAAVSGRSPTEPPSV